MQNQTYKDLEVYLCQDVLNRPDLAGVIPRAAIAAGTAPTRPYFRSHLSQAMDIIQKPYESARDGKRKQLFDGSRWRGIEITTKTAPATPTDLPYTSADTDGINYPAGYRSMRFVYLVDGNGNPHRFPLRSVTEDSYARQYPHNQTWGGWWWGFADWTWDQWGDACRSGQVRWMDKNNKFYLLWTPSNTVTLRMAFDGTVQAPVDQDFNDPQAKSWFTENLFYELAKLTEALMWRSMGEDDMEARAIQEAETLLENAWRLNQAQKSGSNARQYTPPGPGTRYGKKGW